VTNSHEFEQIERILNELKKIKFGSVEIIVHNGQIIQIEKKEKIRLENKSRHAASIE
jgi:hypothetical protein